jgi:hypothetical protein
MNPRNEIQPSLELPQPAKGPEQDDSAKIEAPVSSVESSAAELHIQAPPPIATPDPAQFAQSAQSGLSQVQPAAAPSVASADDVDLIEKEWVTRAKEIVDKTKNDPYIQNKEVNKVKAEYIGKRWHKEIKQADDSS